MVTPGRTRETDARDGFPTLGDAWLWCAIVVGAGLRLWGLSYGLPHVYNPDEVSIMSRALALANNGLNPGNFLYPSLYFYVLAGVVGATALAQVAAGAVESLADFEVAFWTDPSAVYLTGRGVSVLAGLLTIVTTYLLGSRVGGAWTGRVAALLYAVAYIPVRDAHFVKHDVPTTLLVTLVALAAHELRRHGRSRDVILAGTATGVAFATHYYAIFATVLVAAALWLRAVEERPHDPWHVRVGRVMYDRRTWIATAVFATTFAVLSPYVLIDWQTAWRDITANRAILVDRTRDTFGAFGALDEHLGILIGQGTGIAFAMMALAGSFWLARADGRAALLLLSFPIVFLVFLSNSWPYGRTANVLYPFLAVAGGYGVARLASLWRLGRPARRAGLALATLACAWSPFSSAIVMDQLMSRRDTRTLAREWIAAHVEAETVVAVEPYSVPLEPTRDWLAETVATTRGSLDRAGYRVRTWLARSPYPAPAYRVFHIGDGGLDEDKRYMSVAQMSTREGRDALRARGPAYIVLKRFARRESNPLRDALAGHATLVHTVSPFASDAGELAQLPDYDIPPTRDVERPGPIIEIWRLP